MFINITIIIQLIYLLFSNFPLSKKESKQLKIKAAATTYDYYKQVLHSGNFPLYFKNIFFSGCVSRGSTPSCWIHGTEQISSWSSRCGSTGFWSNETFLCLNTQPDVINKQLTSCQTGSAVFFNIYQSWKPYHNPKKQHLFVFPYTSYQYTYTI